MIGKINIKISAANPQMPLGPFHVFAGSAASFTICDIPLPLGVRKVEGVSVQVKNADGETRGLAAVRVGSAWGVTVPAGFLSRSGTVEKGIVITAAGHDDNGEDVSSWKLGAGDVFIMSDDGSVAPGEVRQDLEWFDEVPDNPRNGYVAPVEGVVCVYRNGEWVPLGSQGDVRRADFQDIQELTPGDSSGVIKERFNQMLRTIKGTVAAVAAVVGFAVWAELGPDTIMDDVSGTNTVREVVQAGSEARMLPKYLRALRFADSYPDAAAWYYSRYARAGGACSSVRDGNTLSRNYDWDFDAAPSWVIEMEAGPDRFGSVGVASVGTNLAAGVAVSGSPFFKALPGMTLDGVNENGVAANINVVSSFGHTNGWHGSELHCLGAIRWVLDHATNAQHAAEYLAANVYVPQAMLEAGYSYHYMIADAAETWIVEDGQARMVGTVANRSVMTNFRNFDPQADPYGTGRERYTLLENGGNITSAWFTLAYVAPGRESEFRAPGVDAAAACARAVASWATKPKEQHRGETFEDGSHWWQSVHTSVYDITNRVLRVAVQETDDWYTFAVPVTAPKIDAYTKAETDAKLAEKADVEARGASVLYGDGHVFRFSDGTPFNPYDAEIETYTQFSGATYVDGVLDWLNSAKADCADSGDADEIATLDANGNPTRSGIAKEDVITTDGGTVDGDLEVTGNAEIANLIVRDIVGSLAVDSLTVSGTDPVDLTTEDGVLADSNGKYAHLSNISATDTAFSNAVMGVASHTNADFAAEVLAVQVASLSTNITAEVYIAATNACANLSIDPALIPQGGTLGTVGGLLLALAAAVALLRKKTQLLKSDGTAEDDFATDLLGKPVAKEAIDARLPYPLNTDGTIKDRAINVVTSGAFVIPQGFHDLLIRYTGVPASLTFSGTDASIADYGDDLPTETGDYLVTVTRTKAAECYIRIVTLEARA